MKGIFQFSEPSFRINRSMMAVVFGIVILASQLTTSAQSVDDGVSGDSWSSFRNGGTSAVAGDAALPLHWSPEKGIAWQTELPGYGQSCPVLGENRVFVTAVKGPQKQENLLICLDRKSGEILWQVSRPSSMPKPSNYMASRAAPTPVVDQQTVYAFFESGDLIALTVDSGKIQWEVNCQEIVGAIESNHGLGSSLAQSNRSVFLNLEHSGTSALLAFDKSDGKLSWKKDRPSGSSWSSPIVVRRPQGDQVMISSAGQAVGLDAATGEQRWKIDGLAGNSVPSPHVSGNQVFLGARQPEFGSAEAAAKSNLCLEFSDESDQPKIAWRSQRCIADYASPVACGDYVYLINKNGVLGCLNRETGEEVYRQRLGFDCWATPIVAGDLLYLFGKNGAAAIVKAGDQFDIVSENVLWDQDDPPQPTDYVEFYPDKAQSHGSAEAGQGSVKQQSHAEGSAGDAKGRHQSGPPGASMLSGLLANDQDGDGKLSGDEIPQRLKPVLNNIDLNHDGMLDEKELGAMAKSFAERRSGSRASSRDPIVYGVSADREGFLIRTGTRLFCVVGEAAK